MPRQWRSYRFRKCCSAISPERLTSDGYHLAASGDGTVVQLDRGAAGGIKLHGCVAAIDDQHSTVLYRQRPVLHSQARLSNLAVSRLITSNKYLTPDRHISGGDHHGFIAGAVCRIAVGKVVDMGVDSGVSRIAPSSKRSCPQREEPTKNWLWPL